VRMAVDASAVLAILLGEPDAEVLLAKLLGATKAWISPINWWEVQVRMRSLYGEAGEVKSDVWMESMGLVVEPVTPAQAQTAAAAFSRYKGRPSRLNLGDSFAYALANEKGVPLLSKGNDFIHTDVRSA
jgi:ribonuclease VapC